MTLSSAQQIKRYLDDHAVDVPERGRFPAPDPELEVCVAIPAYDEADRLPEVVESLRDASASPRRFEVVVVVNQPADATRPVARANRRTLGYLDDVETPFPIHAVDRATEGRAFPPDDAGVGRARRIAMDLAADRLATAGGDAGGLIACVDGDSPVADGYIDDVIAAFQEGPDEMLAGVCRYRHPIPDPPEHARAMLAYETWMRYFELGLHHVRTPYAYQPIGSCMVLTARGYALADGVPTREALSDFYLLQKVAKAGGRGAVRQLRRPLVRPSARPSQRVPRGTGPSVRETMNREVSEFEQVEPPRAFVHLRDWFDRLPAGYDDLDRLADNPPPLERALDDWSAWRNLEQFREHAPSADHFERHVHQWFDGLKIFKYCNRLAADERVWIFEALRRLLRSMDRETLASRIPNQTRDDATLEDRRRVLDLLRDREIAVHTQVA